MRWHGPRWLVLGASAPGNRCFVSTCGSWGGYQMGNTLRSWVVSRGGRTLGGSRWRWCGSLRWTGTPLEVAGSQAEERRGYSTERKIPGGT